jgi:hypothetical protein
MALRWKGGDLRLLDPVFERKAVYKGLHPARGTEHVPLFLCRHYQFESNCKMFV